MKGIVDLYRAMKEGAAGGCAPATVLSGDVRKDMQRDCLHVFLKPAGCDGLFDSDETLYLAEHAVLYREADDGFEERPGVLYLSSRRAVFAGDGGTTALNFADVVWVTIYEETPRILEIRGNDTPWFIRAADTETVYRGLQLIRNREYSRVIAEPPLSYAQLLEGADADALLFAFSHTLGGGLPDDLAAGVRAAADSFGKLLAALRQYPNCREEAARFLGYYIPSVVRLIYAYQSYGSAGPDDAELSRLHDRVLDAEHALVEALGTKTSEIYRDAARETFAQADALRSDMERDGLCEGELRLVF